MVQMLPAPPLFQAGTSIVANALEFFIRKAT